MSVTQTIWEVKDLLFSTFRIDPLNIHKSLVGLNGMQLRIMSLVYSTVLNDFYGVNKFCHLFLILDSRYRASVGGDINV
jgi:hypothetical protein